MKAVPHVFLSSANSEFGQLRAELHATLDNTRWKVLSQQNLPELQHPTLEKLDEAIRDCDCVVHIVGRRPGSAPRDKSLAWLRANYTDLTSRLPELERYCWSATSTLTLTQWEAWLALYHGRELLVFAPQDVIEELACEGPGAPPGSAWARQQQHLQLLRMREKRPIAFGDKDPLVAKLLLALHAFEGPPRPPFDWPRPLDFSKYIAVKTEHFVARDWLFERIDRWATVDKDRPLLVLGDFGMGKTAAIGKLLEHWRDRCVVSHFCRYDDDHTLKPGRIVVNIAAQLKDLVPGYRLAVEDNPQLQDLLRQADADPDAALKLAVLNPLHALDDARPKECFLVIDALDESTEIKQAPGANRTTLADLVVDASVRLPPWLRVIITSRRVGPARSAIVRSRFATLEITYDSNNDADIAEYVAYRARSQPPLAAYLQRAGLPAAALAQALNVQASGRFLLVQCVLDDIVNGNIQNTQFDQLPVRIDAFYEQSFNRRIERAGLDPAQVRVVLGLVAVVRVPITIEAIAGVLGLKAVEVAAIFGAFGGLLVVHMNGGVTFSHFSLETWLRGQHDKIDLKVAEQELVAHCRQLAIGDLNEAGDFASYLRQYGVELLTQHTNFDSALELWSALRATLSPGVHAAAELQELRLQSDVVVERLRAHWRRIDGLAGRQRERARAAVAAIAAEHLHGMLLDKDYNTGKYVPVIRSLIECHGDVWPAYMTELLQRDETNDIVFRHDTGVAYAQAWHATIGAAKATLLDQLEALARDAANADHREIAGYALKHICQQSDKVTWWGAILPWLKSLAIDYAHSTHPTDRMVAGEMLLALTIQGEAVTRWFAELPANPPFWNSYWHNLRADIDAIHTLLGTSNSVQPELPGAAAGKEWCEAQQTFAQGLRSRLVASQFFTQEPLGRRLAPLLQGFAAQQDEDGLLDDDAQRGLAQALHGPHRADLLDFIRLLMLHPLWNVTERAATLVSALVRRDDTLLPLIRDLAGAPKELWRIRYGALDAAYDYGAFDRYAIFFELLPSCGRDASCRVQGICIDDLNEWLRDADAAELEARLGDPALIGIIRDWLRTADDVWLLEYLYEMFHDLHTHRRLPVARIAELMGTPTTKLSHYLGSADFYMESADHFMARIEGIRHDEYRALCGAAGPNL
jgi:hypothetical protein